MVGSIVRRGRAVGLLGLGMCCIPSWSADLTEGLPVEDGALGLVLRIAAVLGGAFLLLLGRRFERTTVAALALLVGAAAGLGLLGPMNYGLGLAAAWLWATLALLIHAFAPRVVFGAACLWPLPAVYAYWRYDAGEVSFNQPLLLGLALAGVVLGAALPRLGAALASSALGVLLFALALPGDLPFWAAAGLLALGLLVQLVVVPLFVPAPPGWPSGDTLELKRRRWLQAVRGSLCALLLFAAVVALLAPRVSPQSPAQRARLDRVRAGGALAMPGILLDPADAFYLGGRAVRMGLVGGAESVWDRVALPFLGKSPGKSVHALRAVKEPAELEAMRRAAAITSAAFSDVAAAIRPGANEGEVERAILDGFARRGATGIAFRCVVGSGANAASPHYMENDAVMEKGLVVVDIGCSVDGYASDMTRTFPVAGRYTPAEFKLMETVAEAHEAARALLKAGASYAALDKAARSVIGRAGFGDYFIHGVGHPVGLDVHDPHQDKLEAGMVITLEPGIYIPAGSAAPAEYWDLGVRIEDSYLVTAEGCEALTQYPRIPGETAPPTEASPTP